jgi:hypothetical protein
MEVGRWKMEDGNFEIELALEIEIELALELALALEHKNIKN